MTTVPLVVIPEARQQVELRQAHGRRHPGRFASRRLVLIAAVALGWLLLGYVLLGLSFHLTDPDRARAAFLAGLLVGNGGPAWTVIILLWLEQQR